MSKIYNNVKTEIADLIINNNGTPIKIQVPGTINNVIGGTYISASISEGSLTIVDSDLDGVISNISSAVTGVWEGSGIAVSHSGNDLTISFAASGAVSMLESYFVSYDCIASNALSLLASSNIISNLYNLGNAIYSGDEASILGIFANDLVSYSVSAEDILNQRSFIQNVGHSSGAIRDAVSYVSALKDVHSAAEVTSAISYVTALKDTYYASEIISAVAWIDANQTKAITEVLSESLVVTHISNKLTIELPSVIWLDGGNAADSYDAEEALYDELLNNEYGG